jgi:hypothetical protein
MFQLSRDHVARQRSPAFPFLLFPTARPHGEVVHRSLRVI